MVCSKLFRSDAVDTDAEGRDLGPDAVGGDDGGFQLNGQCQTGAIAKGKAKMVGSGAQPARGQRLRAVRCDDIQIKSGQQALIIAIRQATRQPFTGIFGQIDP